MDFEGIKKLMTLLEESKLHKLHLKQKDFEIHLEKEGAPPVERAPAVPPPAAKVREEPARPAPKPEAEGSFVKAPMVGTFYASPSPDQGPFVKVGDRVSSDTVVGIVEAMKVMNEIKAGVSGVVTEILIENAQPVEFGTKLFKIG